MKKSMLLCTLVGLIFAANSQLLCMSQHAKNIMEGMKLQGVEINSVSKKPDTDSITYTILLGKEGDAGITCTKQLATNNVQCSTFERSDAGLSNFEEMAPEDASAWVEIFDSWAAPRAPRK